MYVRLERESSLVALLADVAVRPQRYHHSKVVASSSTAVRSSVIRPPAIGTPRPHPRYQFNILSYEPIRQAWTSTAPAHAITYGGASIKYRSVLASFMLSIETSILDRERSGAGRASSLPQLVHRDSIHSVASSGEPARSNFEQCGPIITLSVPWCSSRPMRCSGRDVPPFDQSRATGIPRASHITTPPRPDTGYAARSGGTAFPAREGGPTQVCHTALQHGAQRLH